MARRRRTVRRRTARRSNPGRRSMLLVNPRRRRRAAAPARRRNTRRRRATTTRRRNSLVVRANPRRRRATRRRNTSRRRTYRARRRNPARRRTARRRNPVARRKASRVVYRYRTKNRRRNTRRRRNPTFASQIRKIPLVGPVLSNMFSFAPQAVFGALSVEPTMWIAKMAAPFVPMVPASVFYPIVGLFTAAMVQYLPFGSTAMKKQLAIAVASAAGGVGYYKARTGADAEMAAEAGMLELRGVGGLGSLLTVRPGYSGARALGHNPYGYAYNPTHTVAQNGYSDGLGYQVRPF